MCGSALMFRPCYNTSFGFKPAFAHLTRTIGGNMATMTVKRVLLRCSSC